MQKVSNLAVNQASRKTVANLFFEMNLNEALNHIFSENEEFKESAKAQDKEGNRLRAYRSRYQKGKLGMISGIKLLIEYGYLITVEPPDIKK